MSATTSQWRRRARRVIEQVLADLPAGSLEDQKRALRDAYPFGERAHHPYRMWCLEVRLALGLERPKDVEPGSVWFAVGPQWQGNRPALLLWLAVRCGWCNDKINGGCIMCVGHRQYLVDLLVTEPFPSLLAAVRAGRTPVGILADWCEENGHDAVAAALRGVGHDD